MRSVTPSFDNVIDATSFCFFRIYHGSVQGRSQGFDLGGYKSKAHIGHWHDIEFVLGQGDKTTA